MDYRYHPEAYTPEENPNYNPFDYLDSTLVAELNQSFDEAEAPAACKYASVPNGRYKAYISDIKAVESTGSLIKNFGAIHMVLEFIVICALDDKPNPEKYLGSMLFKRLGTSPHTIKWLKGDLLKLGHTVQHLQQIGDRAWQREVLGTVCEITVQNRQRSGGMPGTYANIFIEQVLDDEIMEVNYGSF